jgi:uncharacterized protein YcfJ
MNKMLIAVAFTALAAGSIATDIQAREVCRNVRVAHKESSDTHRIAGTAIGAVAGGVLGNQVGGGKGKTLATVAGAVGGGYAGNKIQQNNQRKHTYYTTERRCRQVD